MRLYLIRHAESKHVQFQVVTGQTICPGLTENGFHQAQRLVKRLRETGELHDCAAFLSSPLPRARQTAETLADQGCISRTGPYRDYRVAEEPTHLDPDSL